MIEWSGYKCFWNETNQKGNRVWQEIVNKLTESAWDTRANEDEKDDHIEVFYVWKTNEFELNYLINFQPLKRL